jgi:hypothetical protein
MSSAYQLKGNQPPMNADKVNWFIGGQSFAVFFGS